MGNGMLVLSRGANESLLISGPAEVRIVRVGPNKVRIGIIAERSVKILRSELLTQWCGEGPHTAPLDDDGGPQGEPELGGTERVAPDLSVLGITPRRGGLE